ncbi:MAG TPA: TIGR02391 family protein [Micromonosporaceae bacterium]|jgi:hypothetical protein
MDSQWAADQLADFVDKINTLFDLDATAHKVSRPMGVAAEAAELDDEIVMLEPIMRQLMNTARSGLGDYERARGDEYHHRFRWQEAKTAALHATGIHLLGLEVKRRLQPDAPELAADQLHEWVWDAAKPAWEIGSHQDAVQAAARLVNAALQRKLSRYDQADLALFREAFSTDQPAPGKPRLGFPGDRTSETWRSRQVGGANFGAGCFAGIRNPGAHEHQLDLPANVALEQLAAFSLLARWIDECSVEVAA